MVTAEVWRAECFSVVLRSLRQRVAVRGYKATLEDAWERAVEKKIYQHPGHNRIGTAEHLGLLYEAQGRISGHALELRDQKSH